MHNKFPSLAVALVLLGVAALGLQFLTNQSSNAAGPATQSTENKMVKVRVMTNDGTLSEPIEQPRFELTDEQWKAKLTPEQYRITRAAGTERAFCGGLLNNHEDGVYVCVSCGLPLFKSDAKFESGTGWPSFFKPIAKENIEEKSDVSYGMKRVETNCARCGSHLGHVFEDGPRPTGLRFCMNSEALKFVKNDDLKSIAEKIPATQPAK